MSKIYYLLNTDFEPVYVIEKYESMIWNHRYYGIGDFELYLPATKETIDIFTMAAEQHYYIIDKDDLTHVVIATSITKETDVDGGNHISLKGYDAKYILKKRIIWGTTYISGNAESELRRVINENVINPELPERKIEGVLLQENLSGEISNIVSAKIQGGYVTDAIEKIAKIYHFGWDVVVDIAAKTFTVKFYKGKDRSADQTDNPRVIFSKKNENLLKTEHKINTDNYRNIVYVDGYAKIIDQGTVSEFNSEGIETRYTRTSIKRQNYGQVVQLDNINYSGMDRYEAYIDGGEQDNSDEEGSKSDLNKWRYSLKTKGKQELDKFEVTTELTGKVVPNINNFVGVNYDLGDQIHVFNEYDQAFKARVTEIIKTSNAKGYSEVPSFAVEDPNKDPDEVKEDDCRINEEETEYRCSEEGEIRVQEYEYIEDQRFSEENAERECQLVENWVSGWGYAVGHYVLYSTNQYESPELYKCVETYVPTPEEEIDYSVIPPNISIKWEVSEDEIIIFDTRLSVITKYEKEINDLVLSSHKYKGGN